MLLSSLVSPARLHSRRAAAPRRLRTGGWPRRSCRRALAELLGVACRRRAAIRSVRRLRAHRVRRRRQDDRRRGTRSSRRGRRSFVSRCSARSARSRCSQATDASSRCYVRREGRVYRGPATAESVAAYAAVRDAAAGRRRRAARDRRRNGAAGPGIVSRRRRRGPHPLEGAADARPPATSGSPRVRSRRSRARRRSRTARMLRTEFRRLRPLGIVEFPYAIDLRTSRASARSACDTRRRRSTADPERALRDSDPRRRRGACDRRLRAGRPQR